VVSRRKERFRRIRPTIAAVVVVGALLVAGGVTWAIASSARGEQASVRFTASGDFSGGSRARDVFEGIAKLDPDLHLALGDLSYGETGKEDEWCSLVTSSVGAGFPFELLAGNHESDGENGNINDFAACLPNQLPGLVGTYGREYYVDVPQEDPLVRFVMISPGINFPNGTWRYEEGDEHYGWTAAAIDGAHEAEIPWVVVSMHKPCISMGQYGCDPGADILNLLIEKRVDLVLTGHEHLYQRTDQLATGDACPALVPEEHSEECEADSDDSMVQGAGTVFATVGTGGVEMRELYADDPEAGYMAAAQGQDDNGTFGSLEVTVTANDLRARFVRAAGENFQDTFAIAAEGR